MSPEHEGAPASVARRDLLRLLVLAPAAAACAGARPAPATKEAAGAPGKAASAAAREDDAEKQLRAIRDAPLPPDAEPAFVFRALRREGR